MVGLLHEEAVGQLAQRQGRHHRGGSDEEAGVLPLFLEPLDHALGIPRSDHHVGLGGGLHRLDGVEVDDLVECDDAAEGRTLVAGERIGVGGGQVVADREAARVGVLDDRNGGAVTQIVDQLPRRVSVEEVEVAEAHPTELLSAVPPTRGPLHPVAGALLMGILAIAEVLGALQGHVNRGRQWIGVGHLGCLVVEPVDDRRVVGRGMGEGLAGQRATHAGRGVAAGSDLFEHRLVVGRVDKDRDVLVVLGRRPHQGRAADVDQVLRRRARRVIERRRVGPEWVEVRHHDVDQVDVVVLEIGEVGRVAAVGEEPAVHPGVEGDDPVAEHGREAGELGHVGDRDAGVGDHPGGAARRDQLHTELVEGGGELRDPRLVIHRQQRTHWSEPSRRIRRRGQGRHIRRPLRWPPTG